MPPRRQRPMEWRSVAGYLGPGIAGAMWNTTSMNSEFCRVFRTLEEGWVLDVS